MFDALTAQFLRSAPPLPNLNPDEIPQLLTRHYAQLVATRLKGQSADDVADTGVEAWPLERIADAYEIVASLETTAPMRRAAAFVAATAHQILSRKRIGTKIESDAYPTIDRDKVDPAVAAALLFLAAEQYADANEAALSMPRYTGSLEFRALGQNVGDLARGRLEAISERSVSRRSARTVRRSIQNRALFALVSTLNEGIEILAASVLGDPLPDGYPSRFESAQSAFKAVLDTTIHSQNRYAELLGTELVTAYAGPHHLASLLLNATDGIQQAALTRIPPPHGADGTFWRNWLRFRARETPYLWRNHRDAIGKEFAQTGFSSVLVLPTGAGKTTVSALKIAGTLARGKKVVFLAPTHALVEQLTDDLQAIFPSDKFGLQVSSDFDALFVEGTVLKDIEVMTPERCLAMMSFEPNAFADVGLLVFDECHLLSPDSGKISRALDGMLCILTFNTVAQEADLLFLSAMLKNGAEFAQWIEQLTGRRCVDVELLWKPSRQARGVVVYEQNELRTALSSARQVQEKMDRKTNKRAKSFRSAAQREIKATPYAVWGLTHNWISTPDSHTFTAIGDKQFPLGAGFANGRLWATPNANQTARRIAVSAASSGVKTIVFVNTKADAVNLSRDIAAQVGDTISLNEREEKIWEALVAELGDAKHAIYGGANLAAVPHNSAMLRLERLLSESLFRRADGAKVIVATPTLAQGLNLPAQLALLAGDKRAGDALTPRESLQAHELLNAAARAGRAGHLANGVVLLIPEPLITYNSKRVLGSELTTKLTSILPEDDRCVAIRDPLEIVLDRISAGAMSDRAVQYTISRLSIIEASDEQPASSAYLLNRSYGAFLARRRNKIVDFDAKVDRLRIETRKVSTQGDAIKLLISSQSGLPVNLIVGLSRKLLDEAGALPKCVLSWTQWVFNWLSNDEIARKYLLHDVKAQILSSVGRRSTDEIDEAVLKALFPGVKGWLEGLPISEIESLLGGTPKSESASKRVCPRARDLVSNIIPRGISFILGVVSRVVDEHDIYSKQSSLDRTLVQSLSAAVRKGFDSVGKLQYSHEHKAILSRVELHTAYKDSVTSLFDDDDLSD